MAQSKQCKATHICNRYRSIPTLQHVHGTHFQNIYLARHNWLLQLGKKIYTKNKVSFCSSGMCLCHQSLSRLWAGHFVMGSSYSAVGFRYPESSSYSWSNFVNSYASHCAVVTSSPDLATWLHLVGSLLQQKCTINILGGYDKHTLVAFFSPDYKSLYTNIPYPYTSYTEWVVHKI